MAQPLARLLPHLLCVEPHVPWRKLREPMVESVIPDILVAIGPGARKKPFRSTGRPSYVQSAILAAIESAGGITTSELAAQLFVGKPTLVRQLSEMQRRRWIADTGGLWRTVSRFRSDDVSLVAIELKLKLWRQALQQAVSYQRFAERSIVVLDGNQRKYSDREVDLFAEAGVGLWLLYGRAAIPVVAPVCVRPFRTTRYLAATFFAS